MKLETFFEKFELFADAPNAVQRMRELVLQLAARGMLVPQSPEDEPAKELLGRIETRIADLRASKQFRGQKVEPLEVDGLPAIPSSWEWVRLGNVVDYGSSEKAESVDIPEDAWVLDLEDIQKDTSKLLQRKLFGGNPSKSTKTAFLAGDVLYGKLRPYLNKVLVADAPGFCTTEIVPIRTFGSIDAAYLCYALKRPDFISYANSKSYGMNLPRLGTDDARRAPFPLPPLAEQQRIVAKVDELMALCDRLDAEQQQRAIQYTALARAAVARFAEAPTPANLEYLFRPTYAITPADLRKTILTLAVQGKLVPQDPRDEAAHELILSVTRHRKQLIGSVSMKRSKPCREFSDDEVPYEIPIGWTWAMLGEITDVGTGSTPSRTQSSFWIGGSIPWITSGSTSKSVIENGDEFVTPAATKAHRLRLYPAGTLLVALYGQGKTRGQVSELGISATINQACAAVCAIDGAPSMQTYLKLLLEKQYDEMRELSAGGAQPNLNVQKIKELLVPVPPLAEQRRIVAKVDELMKLVDQLEAQLALSTNKAEQLMQAIVAELTAADRKVARKDRSAVACYVLQRMRSNPSFGRTAEMKVLYLAEAHLGLPLGGEYFREAAGPFDKWIYDFERQGEKEGWFKVSQERLPGTRSITRYQLLPAIESKVEMAIEELGGARESLDRLLQQLKPLNTEEIEIVATLFSVWNDAVLDGRVPEDNWIVREVRENWHPSKQRFSAEKLSSWLVWMRKHDLVPTGKGRRTQYQPGFELVD